MDPNKTAVIRSWQFPKNITELRAFMGLAQYYRAYVCSFAELSAPLTQMLRRGEKVEPTEARLKAFELLKKAVISPPILGLSQDEGEYVIEVDASQKLLGAVCSQYQNGTLRVIEFASRRLNRSEENFCVTRREILALVFALRQFRPYVLCRHFRIIRPCNILTVLKIRSARWHVILIFCQILILPLNIDRARPTKIVTV